jgi:hypothetical protein
MIPPCKVGDRIRLTGFMVNPGNQYVPVEDVPIGTCGIVNWIGAWDSELTKQISVKWDNGSQLNLLPGDRFEVI